MSFREKRSWISLISYLLIFGFYFAYSFHTLSFHERSNHYELMSIVHLLVLCLVLLLIVEIGLNLMLVMLIPKQQRIPKDEREQLIEYKATKIAYYILCLSMGVAALLVSHSMNTIVSGNLTLLMLFIALVTKAAVQIFYYRRGA